MIFRIFVFTSLVVATLLSLACSKQSSERPSNTPARADNGNSNSANKGDVPPAVKAAFPETQTVTAQQKDLTDSQIASIEKESGSKLSGKEFHSFAAYDGSHKQIGTATIIDVEGQGQPIQLVVVYKNDGVIKKVVAARGSDDVASAAFLGQFTGKGHHDAFHVGEDITYGGSNRAAAEAVTHALKRDLLAMQALYGKAHGH